MTAFIDEHKTKWGVEPICRVLPIAPSTYYAAKKRPAALRTLRDDDLKVEIERVWEDNYKVYGARKIWVALNREGIAVARCTVERLMRELGIRGAVRARPAAPRGRRTTRLGALATSSSAPSARQRPTGYGSPTSLTCGHSRGSSMSVSSSTASPA